MILTISKDNRITVLDSLAEAERQPETEQFSSAKELTKLASNWSTARLVEIWNNLPGVMPVKKFTDRNTGVTRIWKALQELSSVASGDARANESRVEDVAEPAEPVPEELVPEQDGGPTANAEHDAPFAQETRAAATPEPSPNEEPTAAKPARNAAPREGSKTTIILGLLKREGGASLQELMDATGWQKHSVRGFLAGTVGKKMRLTLTSAKKEDGTRVYSLPA